MLRFMWMLRDQPDHAEPHPANRCTFGLGHWSL
jgi:hypothetical protein